MAEITHNLNKSVDATVSTYMVLQIQITGHTGILPALQASDNTEDVVHCEKYKITTQLSQMRQKFPKTLFMVS